MSRKWMKRTIGLILIIIIIVLGFWLMPKSAKADTIKIGLIVPLTGNAADIGKSNKNAFEIAVNEVNAAGGINGNSIKVIIEDSQGCDSATAVTAMQKLVNVDKVKVVYSMCSNVALATDSIAEQGKVVHFGCASNPKVTNLGDYMFRTCPSDDFAGKVAADYIKNKLKINKVAVLHCDKDWCVGIKDSFKDTFQKLGGEILIDEQIVSGATDARTELTKIKETNPELIYFAGYTQESVTVFKQAKEFGLDVPFFGGDAWLDQSIPEKAGKTAENKFFTTPASSYSKEFEQKVNGDIAICTPDAYDIIKLIATVMRKTGTDTEKLKNELYKIKDFKGESGIINFDENGDLSSASFDIKTFKDEKIVDYEKGIRLK